MMIDIIIPTRKSKIRNPDTVHSNVYGFIRSALGLHHLPDDEILSIMKKTPVIEFCLEILKKTTDSTKTPYNIIISESDKGFIDAVNKVLMSSRNDVLLLNDDVFLSMGWLEKLLSCKKGDIRGCKLLYPNGAIQHAGGSLTRGFRGVQLGQLHCDLGQFDRVYEVVYVTFACAYIKRKVINKVGLLDPIYGL